MEEQSKHNGFLGSKFESFEHKPKDKLWESIQHKMSSSETTAVLSSVFQDYMHSPKPRVWRAIEAELFPERRKKMLLLTWSVAAVIIILFSSLFFLRNYNQQHKINSPVFSNNQINLNTDINDKVADKSFKEKNPQSASPIITDKNPTKDNQISSEEKLLKRNILPLTPKKDSLKKVNAFDKLNSFFALLEKQNSEWLSMEKGYNLTVSKLNKATIRSIDLKGMLASNISKLKSTEADMAEPMEILGGTDSYSNNAQLSDYGYKSMYDDIIHSPPLSFALMYSISISPRISIGSGITYTRLNSLGINYNSDWKTEQVNIKHYVGIPLNLNFEFLQRTKFSIYSTTGLQLDYGIREKITTTEYSNEEEISQYSEKNFINKFQSGLNIGFGTNYHLNKQFDAYFQTNLAHYFFLSHYNMWSDNKVWPGIQAGIRYKL